MLIQKDIEQIIFLDIETVPLFSEYEKMPDRFKKLWDKKAEQLNMNKSDIITPEKMYERAGIYAEFGRIICISVAYVSEENGIKYIKGKSFADPDEKILLSGFAQMLSRYNTLNGKITDKVLCAHNGKEFDFPYISRRMLINGIKIPDILNTAGKKPWEVNHLDTMELWKFGDYKNYTSLNLLTAVFDIPTPKDDIDGSEVAKVYWEDKNLDRIVTYCQKDVVAIIQLFLKYQGESLIEEENILFTK
ncbi:MAG: putative 3'-5' exonuclease related to the exonuclease domain of PolB [Bacteroidetes bacterium ADurb.Bin408]|nr:MAG: putative 3'-5' exonuclease related to the exonuclease domain of PolB [Bacteroidetes bacterium ADurb.Bin408]